ncbi:Inner membrane protein [Caenorhabditis elegans]|uniref:Inner membrane protein n=1 Tax=Caenorhabditis elegans TaxID=6239 RepID=H8W3X9_CAEEL|nr:Inner membrane protein [Caenorhabditis elegans]CCG28197.1 Inner membrane protein [Caenorhabditis elegans]|eukprot:NP_001257007.1 Uncharacterized protein CELE_F14H12.17 [Caenorhabditis elegans]
MTFFETDAYLILADIWCSNFSNYWALFLMISFIATIILYKAAHRDEQEIVINVKNRHELENAQLGYIDVMENGQIHRFAIIPSKDGLPLYIRFFLDTVTEPL